MPPTTSFTDIEAEVSEATPTNYSPVAVSTPPASSALAESPALDLEGTGIVGEVRRTDINLPKLTLVNGLSKARTENDAPLGALLFSDVVEIAVPKKGESLSPEVEVIVLTLAKGYQQKTEFGSGEVALRAKTIAEVRELGGTIDRRDKSKIFFEETGQMLLLVPMPEKIDESNEAYFRFEFEGRRYAKALFFVKSIAYTNSAKPIFTRVNNTGEPTLATTYKLWSKFMQTEKNSWWTPMMKVGRLTTPEERRWAASKA